MSIDYTVVVPAYNEADWLPATLAAIQAAMVRQSFTGEVVVCDNNSSDDTAEIAASHGAQVVFEAHNQISLARNRGAREARGRYLNFVDADTLISPRLLSAALTCMEDGGCVGGGCVATE